MPELIVSHATSVLQMNNTNVGVVGVPPPHNHLRRDAQEVYNFSQRCLTIYRREIFTDPVFRGHGRKLEHIKTSFAQGERSLRKYNFSINTKGYEQLGFSGPVDTSTIFNDRLISFQSGERVGKKIIKCCGFVCQKKLKISEWSSHTETKSI